MAADLLAVMEEWRGVAEREAAAVVERAVMAAMAARAAEWVMEVERGAARAEAG